MALRLSEGTSSVNLILGLVDSCISGILHSDDDVDPFQKTFKINWLMLVLEQSRI